MRKVEVEAVESSVNQWGNGLALRLTKAVAKTAGVKLGTAVRIVAQPGRIIIERSEQDPTLEEMLASFDPKRHSGEAMALQPVGREVL
jgi:antitoxin component of MazEF toxin-antitoxin module